MDNSPLPELVQELRKSLKLSQTAFALKFGVSQVAVSRWEQGHDTPGIKSLMTMAELSATRRQKAAFLWLAGMEGFVERMGKPLLKKAPLEMPSVQMVPVLADGVAAGDGRIVNEKDIEHWVPLPMNWFKNAEDIYVVNIDGDSMEPMLRDGDQALIDVSQRDPNKLTGAMVAAIVGEGVTVKFLRKAGKFYQLVPLNTSPRHEIRVLSENDDWGIVGKVVKWIGEPPPPPKKAR